MEQGDFFRLFRPSFPRPHYLPLGLHGWDYLVANWKQVITAIRDSVTNISHIHLLKLIVFIGTKSGTTQGNCSMKRVLVNFGRYVLLENK